MPPYIAPPVVSKHEKTLELSIMLVEWQKFDVLGKIQLKVPKKVWMFRF